MEVKIENLINVWYDQIPTLFINLVNAIVLARDEKELREVIDHFHKNPPAATDIFLTSSLSLCPKIEYNKANEKTGG